jgi:hypothetical protein
MKQRGAGAEINSFPSCLTSRRQVYRRPVLVRLAGGPCRILDQKSRDFSSVYSKCIPGAFQEDSKWDKKPDNSSPCKNTEKWESNDNVVMHSSPGSMGRQITFRQRAGKTVFAKFRTPGKISNSPEARDPLVLSQPGICGSPVSVGISRSSAFHGQARHTGSSRHTNAKTLLRYR